MACYEPAEVPTLELSEFSYACFTGCFDPCRIAAGVITPPGEAGGCPVCCGSTPVSNQVNSIFNGFISPFPCGTFGGGNLVLFFNPNPWTFAGHTHSEPCKWVIVADVAEPANDFAAVLTLTCPSLQQLDYYLYGLGGSDINSMIHWQANTTACNLDVSMLSFSGDASGVTAPCLTQLLSTFVELSTTIP